MPHNIVGTDVISITQICAQIYISLMLGFGVGINAIIQVDQLDAKAVIIARFAAFPHAFTGVPGTIAIAHVLDNFSVFTDGIMRANLGIGIIKPVDHPFERTIGGRVNGNGGNIIRAFATIVVG